MPLDGIVVRNLKHELNDKLTGGRIEKVFQPAADEIILNIRAKGMNCKLLLSANASFPRVHTTDASKENPAAPPMFCMLLRKHLSGGRILRVTQENFERIIEIAVESVNELGDLAEKRIITEIMGKHSNIILVNADGKIIDSIKHVTEEISSVREVLPGLIYEQPPSQGKFDPLLLDVEVYVNNINSLKSDIQFHDKTSMDVQFPDKPSTDKPPVGSLSADKYLLNSIKGFSPLICREICFRAKIQSGALAGSLDAGQLQALKETLSGLVNDIKKMNFNPCIIHDAGGRPADFHAFEIRLHGSSNLKCVSSINEALDIYYTSKGHYERVRQKKNALSRIINNELDKCRKKLSIQQETLKDVADRNMLKLLGELITANIYRISPGSREAAIANYYSENDETITVELDENLTPQENAQAYYKKYAKARNTFNAVSVQMEENLREISYLESVSQFIDEAASQEDLEEIRQEMISQGLLSTRAKVTITRLSKRNDTKSGKKPLKTLKTNEERTSRPLKFISSDGFTILVGKNNRQNDILTMKSAHPGDMWFHTRNIPGSHVIIKTGGRSVPVRTLEEAAKLSAYHSRAKQSSNVPVDYTEVKNVKKPPGAKPGMVIYENFKTAIVTPDESLAEKLMPPTGP